EREPEWGPAGWGGEGRRGGVPRARPVGGDASVDRILRAVVRELRGRALEAGADGARLRALAGRLWAERHGAAAGADPQERLF
ncbi:MAG: hypothetical protein RL190_1923, partial [Actinomycetota bacterium]